MLKITAIVSLLLIGSTLWAASLSCDSCGSECASACGTRHFRSCCFNYLRRKRGSEPLKLSQHNTQDTKTEKAPKFKMPMFLFENMAEPWSNYVSPEYRTFDDDQLQIIYDI